MDGGVEVLWRRSLGEAVRLRIELDPIAFNASNRVGSWRINGQIEANMA
jgi:hypothetical protein